MILRRCTRCIMDNSADPTITFDRDGVCNYCTEALVRYKSEYFPNEEGEKRLLNMLEEVKENGKGKPYDCIMGVSGGLDSSYLLYLGSKWGLRILAVHIDDGFDTDITKSNLDKLVSATGVDYKVITPDSTQFANLTKAYMKAGVANLAAPQDNILFAFLYKQMRKYNLKYFLSGGNYALECILQDGNTHNAYDLINLKDINKKNGNYNISKLELISSLRLIIDRKFLKIETLRPLNYIDYNRDRAFAELHAFCGYEYYGRKHLENILTAFVQLFWLPNKFGVDKRTSHLSSMIISGQMTRDEALNEMQKPLYDEILMDSYIEIIKEKLHLSDEEFIKIMEDHSHDHTEYKTEKDSLIYKLIKLGQTIKNKVRA